MTPEVFQGGAVHCALRSEPICGESPVWSVREQALFWTDIEGARLWRYGAIDGGTESWALPDRLGSFEGSPPQEA